jgi:CBS-domain-containing membrane protein
MAHGLPVEGTAAERPTARSLMRDDVATCALEEPAAEVAQRIDASPYQFALAVSAGSVLLGRVRRSRIADAGSSAHAEDVMELGPSTVRPHRPAEELATRLASGDVRTLIVTDPEGRLLGVVRRVDVERLG